MGMDHNIDLLKQEIHQPTRKFIQLNENINLISSIMRLTRITNNSATLIDNIFVDAEYVQSLKSQIIIDDISDHLPNCTILENVNMQMRDKKKILTRKINDKAITMIHD